MYPYLKKDLDDKRITKKLAQSILECLFLKVCVRTYPVDYHRARRVPGVGGSEKVTIGGTDSSGHDVTNDLSFMLLESHAHTHMHDFVLSLRMHRDTPDDILKATLQVLRIGSGIPHIINDEAIIPSLLRLGIPVAEARNYADIGCQENVTDPNTCGADVNPRSNAGYFNLPKMVHLALYDGIEKMTGVQAGPKTGNPNSFKTMNEFFEAVKKQIDHAVYINCIYNNLMDWAWANWQPAPVLDLLHPGPRKTGIEYNDGGCKYNWTGAIGVGLGTAADALSAIEWLNFDKKEVTFDRLIEAMDCNWEGYADIKEKCLRAPKYGKDDDYADKWAVAISSAWMDAYERHRTSHGGIFVGGFFSMSNYVWMGHDTWATPDGRSIGDPLSSAIDPSNGVDLEGPVRLHKSAAKLDTWRITNGTTFNCKFTTAAVSGERELAKWADLVRTFILLKGQSIQYTIVNSDALKKAQEHPDQYKDLIVRTGGYSAFFVELSKEIQDSVIARVEHTN
jgi:formate C-acetyltransferase